MQSTAFRYTSAMGLVALLIGSASQAASPLSGTADLVGMSLDDLLSVQVQGASRYA